MPFDEFVDDVFVAVLYRFSDTGEIPNCQILPEQARVVIVVYQCIGAIGNGGFRLLLSADFDGDPGYELTYEAFQIIHATGAILAFDRLFNIFENKKLPNNIEERMDTWDQNFTRFDNDTPDTMFYDSDEETLDCLREYIVANYDSLKQMIEDEA